MKSSESQEIFLLFILFYLSLLISVKKCVPFKKIVPFPKSLKSTQIFCVLVNSDKVRAKAEQWMLIKFTDGVTNTLLKKHLLQNDTTTPADTIAHAVDWENLELALSTKSEQGRQSMCDR